MPKRLIITKVCLRILQVMLIVAAIAISIYKAEQIDSLNALQHGTKNPMVSVMAGSVAESADMSIRITLLVMAGFALAIEFLVRGLSKLRYWAWVTCIVLFGLMLVPDKSDFARYGVSFAMGGIGLWGLLDADTVRAFTKHIFQPVNAAISTDDRRPSTED